MGHLGKHILAFAALAASISAMLQPQAGAHVQGRCEIPVGNCDPYDGELGCEFCCVDFRPAPGSLCHIDLEFSGWCGDEPGKGIIYHCGTHDD